MSRIKTKRILWTIAVLFALSLVAGMVLHKREEPKIIGNLSKEDVKEISRIVFHGEREGFLNDAGISLKNWQFTQLRHTTTEYIRSRITYIATTTNGEAFAFIGHQDKYRQVYYRLVRTPHGWGITPSQRRRPKCL